MLLPCLVSASTLSYIINGLPVDSVEQEPTGPGNVLATIIASPQSLEADFLSVFGEEISRKPSFEVGWDRTNALGASRWTTASSPNEHEFFGFAIAAAEGYQIAIDGINFQWGSTQDGPSDLVMTIDVGNLSTGLNSENEIDTYSLNTGTGNNPAATHIEQPLSISATSDIIIFRFYGFGGSGDTGNNKGGFWDETGDDPIELSVTVSAVPEPNSTAAVFCIAALTALAWSKRRRG